VSRRTACIPSFRYYPVMPHRICPWWLGYFLISPVRRWLENPEPVIRSHVHQGMSVLEPGPGMGFFTLPLARLVGASGRVIAVDVQPKMIERLKRRAAKAALMDRIDARVTSAESLQIDDLAGKVDFTLAYAMVHELPSAAKFFAEVSVASKPGAKLLLAEPRGHVNAAAFEKELGDAAAAHFQVIERLSLKRSLAAVLVKT
jgi:SAM-dependent methyltransferase